LNEKFIFNEMKIYLFHLSSFRLKMFVGASNVCKWVNTRKPGYCNKPCVGTYCAFHNHAIKNERPLAEACKNCDTNGTRSTTGLCQECGASKQRSKAWRENKKNANV
jgi:hypothetical protein